MSDGLCDTLQDHLVPERADVAASTFTVAVLTRDEVKRHPHWEHAFAGERKDHRYYELVEETIQPEFDYRYFVIQDEAGEVCAVQPFFLLDQDMLAGTGGWVKSTSDFVRRLWPRFMMMRTLMVGCAAGEGHLDSGSPLPRTLHARLLADGITSHARELKARLIVLKEFPAAERAALTCFLGCGYTRVPSLPMTQVSIEYASFDDYVSKALSRNARVNLRKKFKNAQCAGGLDMTVYRDITPMIDDVYPLYYGVFERSKLRFEKLTKAYFCQIGQTMPDKVRFFVWRNGKRIVAFGLCMVEGGSFYSEYVGFDYNVAFKWNLYHVVVRDIMSWAMAQGYKSYRNTSLNYEPKLHLRNLLDPLDLYVKHTSPVLNAILRHILPIVEPTRYDKILRRFPNYDELWGQKR